MRSRPFFAISLALCLAGVHAAACGPWYYQPREYMMYRAYADYLTGEVPEEDFNYGARENCLLWQSQTGGKASLEDIYHVVYKVSPEDYFAFGRIKGGRSFTRVLRMDSQAEEALALAKRCEYVRSKINSPWWYPSKDDPEMATLEDIAEDAMSYRSGRFLGRYVLQGLRALFTLHRYDDCINWWDEVEERIPDDVIKRMSMRYVAGAYFNTGDTEQAKALYGRAGDIESLLYCSGTDGAGRFDTLLRYAPDSRSIRTEVERSIISYSRWYGGDTEDREWRRPEREALMSWIPKCTKAAEGGRVSDPEFWYYSAAYIHYLCGDDGKADEVLRKAEGCAKDRTLKESIRVFRIYLDAVLTPYSPSYEAAMAGKLRWLDTKIAQHMAEAAGLTASYGIWRMKINLSYYYWNDVMRKIVLGVICPKLVEHGRGASAIAFANMADNRLLNMVGRIDDYSRRWTGSRYVERTEGYSVAAYRRYASRNDYDYSNELFALLDTVRVEDIIEYVRRLDAPESEVDRFLAGRSYTDRSFFREIIGTRLLREMRYREAESWFSMVPDSHMKTLNTFRDGHFGHDPFSIVERGIESRPDWKLSFARRMADLQEEISTRRDPDRKALAFADYATGMQNSVTTCWALTFYGRYWGDDLPEYGVTRLQEARERMFGEAERHYRMALRTARNPETLASIHYSMRNLATVMRDFPETSVAKQLAGKCDNYLDFHLEGRKSYDCNIWIDY